MPADAVAPRHHARRDRVRRAVHPCIAVPDRTDDCARWRAASRLGPARGPPAAGGIAGTAWQQPRVSPRSGDKICGRSFAHAVADVFPARLVTDCCKTFTTSLHLTRSFSCKINGLTKKPIFCAERC